MESRKPIFKIQGTSIPVIDNVKCLGFLLDGKLNWLDHFDEIRESIMSFIINVNKTGLRDKGRRSSIKKIWYNLVIEKRISYGYESWISDLRIHAIRRLSSCQRMGLLSI